MAGMVVIAGQGATPDTFVERLTSIFANSYDAMELANAMQSIVSLGSVAVMIPALWLASAIVRDRPFSSYSSSRGGWSSKVFWRTFPVAFICIGIPIIIDNLFYYHNLGNFQMKFTLASFAVVTILGPLQCIAEEYLFRGLLMQTLGSWFRLPVIAVLIQSGIFVTMHPYNTVGKISIFVSGTVFAVCALIGRGIEVSSAYHIANNMAVFYMQGLNVAVISSESTVQDLILESVCAAVFVLLMFTISKKTNWFNEIKKDDAAAWNAKIDEKAARKEAKEAAKAEKAAAKAEKAAAKNAKIGAHEESAPGKHFKQ
jgi:membrane protease YdiL (CAAX protease family)